MHSLHPENSFLSNNFIKRQYKGEDLKKKKKKI